VPSGMALMTFHSPALTSTNLPIDAERVAGAAPYRFDPQHSPTPSVRSAQVWYSPVLTRVKVAADGGRIVGAWPAPLLPQHSTTLRSPQAAFGPR